MHISYWYSFLLKVTSKKLYEHMPKITSSKRKWKMTVFILLSPCVVFLKWDHYSAYCFETCSFNLKNIFWASFQRCGIGSSLKGHMLGKWGNLWTHRWNRALAKLNEFSTEAQPREMTLLRWGRNTGLGWQQVGTQKRQPGNHDRAFPNSRGSFRI